MFIIVCEENLNHKLGSQPVYDCLWIRRDHRHSLFNINTTLPMAAAIEGSKSKGIILVFSSPYLHEIKFPNDTYGNVKSLWN